MKDTFIIETFDNQEITFDFLEHDMMVNATEMIQPFKKRIDHFLANENTQEYIKSLIKSKDFLEKIPPKYPEFRVFEQDYSEEELKNFVIQTRRGNHGGTYMCQDLAIYFAMWLSPEFAVWVTQTIRKLFLGNDPIKTRRLLQEIPKLFQETKALKSQARKLKIKTLDIDAQKTKKILKLNLISIETKIKSLIDHAAQLDLFDSPEEIGRRMIRLSQEKAKIENEIFAINENEKQMLNFEDYLNIQKNIKTTKEKLTDYITELRNN